MFLVPGTRTYVQEYMLQFVVVVFVVVVGVVVVVVVVVAVCYCSFVSARVVDRVVLDHLKRHGALSRVRDAAHRRQHCCY